jgi:DNA-directed RNA polymerase subunit F
MIVLSVPDEQLATEVQRAINYAEQIIVLAEQKKRVTRQLIDALEHIKGIAEFDPAEARRLLVGTDQSPFLVHDSKN